MNKNFIAILLSLSIFLISSCAQEPIVYQKVVSPDVTIEAMGYSSMINNNKHSPAQQKLLAIRSAKLDAYRNLAEEVYGVRIKSNTTVKDLAIKSDSFRAYVDAVVHGAHVTTITPKDDGIFEVEVSLSISPVIYNCITQKTPSCYQDIELKHSDFNY